MDKPLESHKHIRVARTLDIASSVSGAAMGNSNSFGVAGASPAPDDGLAQWKEAARKQMEVEFTRKYDAIYAKKLKDIAEKETSYKNACASLAELLTAVKKSADDKLSVCLKDLDAITVMLVLESLYKLIGDDDKYAEYVPRVVEHSVKSLGDAIPVLGLISVYDYTLLSGDPVFATVKDFIRADEKLKKGQFHLDDGSSIYELGILDRLDALRLAFVNAVSKA